MIFDAKEILEVALKDGERKACSFRASKSILERFKKTCKKDGMNNYSHILEELIKRFLTYCEDGQTPQIRSPQIKDQLSTSLTCSAKTWETFTSLLPEFGLNRVRVLEFLMEEYCNQREKGRKKRR